MYAVISANDADGTLVDEFATLREAENFASDLSAEGYNCTICQMLRTLRAQKPESHNVGIYAPFTMQPQHLRHVA